MALSNRLLTKEDVERCGGGGSAGGKNFLFIKATHGSMKGMLTPNFTYAEFMAAMAENHACIFEADKLKPLTVQLFVTRGSNYTSGQSTMYANILFDNANSVFGITDGNADYGINGPFLVFVFNEYGEVLLTESDEVIDPDA